MHVPLIPLCSPKKALTPTALALGSFDGLHAGHRSVIEEIVNNRNGIPTVVSFWPHPREILFGEPRLRIDLPSEKTSLLTPLGVEQLVLIPFDRDLAAKSAEFFVKNLLIETLKARRIAVGANFRFGKNREGSPSFLKKRSQDLHASEQQLEEEKKTKAIIESDLRKKEAENRETRETLECDYI